MLATEAAVVFVVPVVSVVLLYYVVFIIPFVVHIR